MIVENPDFNRCFNIDREKAYGKILAIIKSDMYLIV